MILLTRPAYAGGLRGGLTQGLREKTGNSLRGAYAAGLRNRLTQEAYAEGAFSYFLRSLRGGAGFRTALTYRQQTKNGPFRT